MNCLFPKQPHFERKFYYPEKVEGGYSGMRKNGQLLTPVPSFIQTSGSREQRPVLVQ